MNGSQCKGHTKIAVQMCVCVCVCVGVVCQGSMCDDGVFFCLFFSQGQTNSLPQGVSFECLEVLCSYSIYCAKVAII